MDLENRVKQLEQEVAVLKGQIQTTLLDIQEQLLTNAYPALRSEAFQAPVAPRREPEHARQDAVTAAPPDAPAAPAVAELPPVAMRPLASLPEQDCPPAPVIQVRIAPSAEDTLVQPSPIRTLRIDDSAADNKPLPLQEIIPAGEELGHSMVDQLADWTASSVEDIGVERTLALVESYARRGKLTAAMRETLLQAINLYSFYESNGALDVEFEALSPLERSMTPRERRRHLIVRLVDGFLSMNDSPGGAHG